MGRCATIEPLTLSARDCVQFGKHFVRRYQFIHGKVFVQVGVGPVRTVLEGNASPAVEAALEQQTTLLLTAYLQAHASAAPCR